MSESPSGLLKAQITGPIPNFQFSRTEWSIGIHISANSHVTLMLLVQRPHFEILWVKIIYLVLKQNRVREEGDFWAVFQNKVVRVCRGAGNWAGSPITILPPLLLSLPPSVHTFFAGRGGGVVDFYPAPSSKFTPSTNLNIYGAETDSVKKPCT